MTDSLPDPKTKSESMGSLLSEEDPKSCPWRGASPTSRAAVTADQGSDTGRPTARASKDVQENAHINRRDLMNSRSSAPSESRIMQYEKEP